VAFWTLSFQKMKNPDHGSKQRVHDLPPVVAAWNEKAATRKTGGGPTIHY
jgi:hypothetical protein